MPPRLTGRSSARVLLMLPARVRRDPRRDRRRYGVPLNGRKRTPKRQCPAASVVPNRPGTDSPEAGLLPPRRAGTSAPALEPVGTAAWRHCVSSNADRPTS